MTIREKAGNSVVAHLYGERTNSGRVIRLAHVEFVCVLTNMRMMVVPTFVSTCFPHARHSHGIVNLAGARNSFPFCLNLPIVRFSCRHRRRYCCLTPLFFNNPKQNSSQECNLNKKLLNTNQLVLKNVQAVVETYKTSYPKINDG